MNGFAAPTGVPVLIEDEPVHDIFVTGAMPPEAHNGFVRVTYYAERRTDDGTMEYVKRVAVCMPIVTFKAIMRLYYPLQRAAVLEAAQDPPIEQPTGLMVS